MKKNIFISFVLSSLVLCCSCSAKLEQSKLNGTYYYLYPSVSNNYDSLENRLSELIDLDSDYLPVDYNCFGALVFNDSNKHFDTISNTGSVGTFSAYCGEYEVKSNSMIEFNYIKFYDRIFCSEEPDIIFTADSFTDRKAIGYLGIEHYLYDFKQLIRLNKDWTAQLKMDEIRSIRSSHLFAVPDFIWDHTFMETDDFEMPYEISLTYLSSEDDLNYKFNRKYNQLYAIDDFICIKAYGMKLFNDYVYGSPFKLSFNYSDAVFELMKVTDFNELDKQGLNLCYELLDSKRYSTNSDTFIDCKNNQWHWLDSNGETISEGRLSESKLKPGLVQLILQNSSSKSPEISLDLYFDGNDIYIPLFVKSNVSCNMHLSEEDIKTWAYK